jgi:hypothetical protein
VTAIQWFAFVILPLTIALAGYLAVVVFERTHPMPPSRELEMQSKAKRGRPNVL